MGQAVTLNSRSESYPLIRPTQGGRELVYGPVEVSQRVLGIVAVESLTPGEDVVLRLRSGDIPMEVREHRRFPLGDQVQQYALMARDRQTNLEASFLNRPISSFLSPAFPKALSDRLAHDRVRAARFSNLSGFRVVARTFGSPTVFDLRARDVSKTGMLLVAGGHKDAPFRVNTLIELEITLDHGPSQTHERVPCMGKVVRTLRDDKDTGVSFAVAISEIDPGSLAGWDRALEAMVTQRLDDQAV